MAAESRGTGPDLTGAGVGDPLFDEPYRFRFFQAVRLIESMARGRPRVGHEGPPQQEQIRFVSEQSLSFPAAEILGLEEGQDGRPARMTVRFLGLTGPQGVLPRHYTELIISRARQKDRALGDFLDIFNHRAVSLFYRSWTKYRLYFESDADLTGQLARSIFSFIGLGTRGLRDRLAIPDAALLFYAGLIAQRPHSVTALEGILEDYFSGVQARVLQFVGQWLALDPDSWSQIGRVGKNNRLGVETVLGSRVWDTQSRFRVRLGPMTYQRFCEMLPDGGASRSLLELTRFFVGQEYDFEFQLVLLAAEVPGCSLGARGAEAPRLGWSTWLKSRAFQRDADDPVFDAEALRRHFEKAAKERS